MKPSLRVALEGLWCGLLLSWSGVAADRAGGAQATVAPKQSPPEAKGAETGRFQIFDVTRFGARGDDSELDTEAFQAAIQACGEAGGGTVVVPPGVYVCAPIELRSDLRLRLEPGARLQASRRLADYPEEAARGWGRGSGESNRAGLITARNATNVAIVGGGVIDGAAMAFHDPRKPHGRVVKTYTRQGEDYMDPRFGTRDGPIAHGERPGNLLRFFNCSNVQLRSVTIQNSPTWTVQFNGCTEVDVRGVAINSFASGRRVPNDDGIDLFNCRRVHIADCDIQTGDDCLAIFAGEAVTVMNCTLASRSSGIRVGYVGGDIRDCVFENLVIDSNRGISLFVRGGDSIENLAFANIVIRSRLMTGHWWGQAEPIHVSVTSWDPKARRLGRLRNVRFANIQAEAQSGILLYGDRHRPIQDLAFDNVRLRLRGGALQEAYGGNFDLRAARSVKRQLFAHDIPALYARYVDGLRLRDFEVTWDEDLPAFFNHALQIEDTRDLVVDGFEGRQPQGTGAAIALARVAAVSLRNSRAAPGTDVFLRHEDVLDARLFTGNDLLEARTVFQPATQGFTAAGNLFPAAP